MRFHMHLLPTYFPDLDPPFDIFYQQILEQICLAEELGWECFWFTEHHFALYGGPEPNPAVFLGAAAARTSRIHLGSAVSILPLHHPIQIAEDYAMVDVLSRGRLEFGIGLGNTPSDFLVYGVPREEARPRFEEEGEIIARAWAQDRFSYAGRFWDFKDVCIYPRPVQQPSPRIWVAGHSPESLGWAGRHGFNIMITAHPYPPEHYPRAIDAWRDGLGAAGLTPKDRNCKVHLRVWVDENAERAREVAQAAILRYDELAAIGRGRTDFDPSTYDFSGMLATGRNVYGNPDQCIAGIRNAMAHYEFDIFSTTFNFGGIPHADIMRAMRLFAREVMPAFKGVERTMEPRDRATRVGPTG
ncbi:MAG TPA: LLM class flavin-dependent oxidoreductase [Chloroflexota bacterium]|nr:LLM class flavin-dependent oxidoreductase [Chloroflexota bacterium]